MCSLVLKTGLLKCFTLFATLSVLAQAVFFVPPSKLESWIRL